MRSLVGCDVLSLKVPRHSSLDPVSAVLDAPSVAIQVVQPSLTLVASLLDRLRSALADQYDVQLVLASGGMGVVFLARDRTLERPVAIKVIRPELATAQASERFLREARILAKVNHPNVIPVHQAGERDGLSFYVMDYLEEDTLESRLTSGPLRTEGAIGVGRDLLNALDAIHRQGIVHRDVKPSNIFIVNERAVLADFGIAKEPLSGDESLTATGMAPGTPKYMAPELFARGEASPATDLYSAAMVLYEAMTGRPWATGDDPEKADWSGVPAQLVATLRRALALSPGERWQDAASFRAALAHQPPRRRTVTIAGGVALVAVGVVVLWGLWRDGERPYRDAAVHVRIELPFHYRGPDSLMRIADSLGRQVAVDVQSPEILLVGGVRDAGRAADYVITGRVEVSGDSVRLTLYDAKRHQPLFPAQTASLTTWAALADGAVNAVLDRLYGAAGAGLQHVVPSLPAAHKLALQGEQFYARGWWSEAYEAYADADDLDSTCLLCAWRMTNIERWLGRVHDSTRTRRYLDGIDRFPRQYQDVIRASRQPSAVRLDSLRAVAERWRNSLDAWFIHADEAFHRGPLVGARRAAARRSFEQAIGSKPEFAPAVEHLVWLLIVEGDSAGASQWLAHLASLPAPGADTFSTAHRAMLRVAWAWRFDTAGADALTAAALQHPAVAGFTDLGGGARLMLSFDAPLGAVAIGRMFARGVPRRDVALAGRVAQITGHLALGQPDSARHHAELLRGETGDRETDLFAAELTPALFLVDREGVRPAVLRSDLERMQRLAEFSGTPPHLRNRAAWMVALVRRHQGDERAADRIARLIAGEPAPRPLATLIAADSLAARRRWELALERSAPLLALDSGALARDPFFRAILHVKRAQWWLQHGDTLLGAVPELRWHENVDVEGGIPRGTLPGAAEIDWAFGTFARWWRARLLDAAEAFPDVELCPAYQAVVRHWSAADAPYAERAEFALRRLPLLGCTSPP